MAWSCLTRGPEKPDPWERLEASNSARRSNRRVEPGIPARPAHVAGAFRPIGGSAPTAIHDRSRSRDRAAADARAGPPMTFAVPVRQLFRRVAVRMDRDASADDRRHPRHRRTGLHTTIPALTLPLIVADEPEDVAADWQAWGRALNLPLLVVTEDGTVSAPMDRTSADRSHGSIRRRAQAAPARIRSCKGRRSAFPDAAQEPAVLRGRAPGVVLDPAARSSRGTDRGRVAHDQRSAVGDQPGEDDPAVVAVAAEEAQAVLRVVDVERRTCQTRCTAPSARPDRPAGRRRRRERRRRRARSRPHRRAPATAWCSRRRGARSSGRRSARRPPCPGGRRSCRSRSSTGCRRHRGAPAPIEAAEDRRPAHQRAPREGEAEADLRPVGDALHEGVDRDRRQREDAEGDREAVELEEHDEADQRLRGEEDLRLGDAHLPARDRPGARARDRARRCRGRRCRCRCSRRRAWRWRRPGKENEVPEVRPWPGGVGRQRRRPPARP